MFKLTRKTEYALLALHELSNSGETNVTKVRDIATRNLIPFPVLAKVMQNLARHNYVEPTQGAKGGYQLHENAMKTNMWQFLEEMEGPQGLADCFIQASCEQLELCSIRSPLKELDRTIRRFFYEVQLKDILAGSSNHSFGAPSISGTNG